jgi:hypothetical protein
MTKEFPIDPMTNTPVRLLIRAWGFFRHYGLGISHSTQRQGLVILRQPHLAGAFSGICAPFNEL